MIPKLNKANYSHEHNQKCCHILLLKTKTEDFETTNDLSQLAYKQVLVVGMYVCGTN